MAKKLKRICVLSGPGDEVDLSRAGTAKKYYESLESKVPFRILGAGPNLEEALENSRLLKDKMIGLAEYNEKMRGLDHHLALYESLMETGEKVETVISSVTLVQNVRDGFSEDTLRSFSDEPNGKYAVVTEPWHYGKFKLAAWSLKRKGRIPKGLEFFNVASEDKGYYNFVRKMFSYGKTWLELIIN